MLYNSSGVLVVDPPSGRDGPPKPWWIMLRVEDDLRRYYAWFVKREMGECIQAPAWHAHVSVVRGECPRVRENWRALNGKRVSFAYDGELKTNDEYWWMLVDSPELEQIRCDLGLSPQPRVNFHLSLGIILPWKADPWLLCVDDGSMSKQPVDTRKIKC